MRLGIQTTRTGPRGIVLSRQFLRIPAVILLLAAVSFGSAGTLDWPRGWIYLARYAGGIAVSAILILRTNPEVAAARGRIRRDAKAFLPASAAAVLFLVRASLEDRTLSRELPGYAEYARRTRSRLCPGVW
jgi:hypothetical protein